jgi:hypothetical protein
MIMIMGSAPLVMQKQAPTRELAEKYVDDYLARILPWTLITSFLRQCQPELRPKPAS